MVSATINTSAPVSPEVYGNKLHPDDHHRRASFGMLLRRSKSGDLGKSGRKNRAPELVRQPTIPQSPPRLPDLYNGAAPPTLQTFGGDERPDSVAIMSGQWTNPPRAVPMPPIPRVPEWVDPYARTESMTHRGRYSYASSAVSSINSPRRVRRRRDPTPFNILIIGAAGAGKTSFLNFLKTSLALPPKKRPITRDLPEDVFGPNASKYTNFKPHYLETEIDGERVGLTLWDSEGLDKGAVELQLRDMSFFVESKFKDTFNEEMKVIRAPGVQDTHIHCTFLILDPARLDRNIQHSQSAAAHRHTPNFGPLDADLDIQVLRTLQGKTTVVPVISKADTVTSAHMKHLKKSVYSTLKAAHLDPLEALGLIDVDDDSVHGKIDEEDEEAVLADGEADAAPHSPDAQPAAPGTPSSTSPAQAASPASVASVTQVSSPSRRHRRNLSADASADSDLPYLPLSIISPDEYEPEIVGRQFPWGFADPYNAQHCDFVRLKESVFSEWRGELREASREVWYERWRTSRLKHRDTSAPPLGRH